ncbi:alpha/beta hydrolase fold domain-containing protein [Spirosoma validum]|uniref:Alpha/beta hydrolase fold domain-containing protein n=1 Tax=Spirosoma validum TaxID=2771355 RepID=A0A927B5I5_9BACT|nr:alpha/beta hydrolase [Spirosoma validum]MBD2755728.1 alpha/beta hydrolase fold domain-containing protein [Spirosoma validum]
MKNVHPKQDFRPLSLAAFGQKAKSISNPVRLGLLLLIVLGLALPSCQDHLAPQPGQVIQDNGPKPSWGPTITPQMLAVINKLGQLAPVPIENVTPDQARKTPSFKDAVNALLDERGISRPTANVTITERTVPGYGGVPLRAKVYTPKSGSGPFPVIVYFHGGGWVIASADVYEYSTLALAEETGAVVISVDYRLAPENKFPTAHRDAFASYKWISNNLSQFNGNGKIAVAGESAGGNMAVNVSIMARDSNLTNKPLHILSVFPVANNNLYTYSYNAYANAKPLSRPGVMFFTKNYFNSDADGDSPLISLVDVANLSNLPPVTIIGAEIDPLQTDGMDLRDKLIQVGNKDVRYELYKGVTHEFFGMYSIVPEAQQAQALAATRLKAAFQ